ncbi:MAG: fumarylacetoacetate hydrolase family protein [Chloroflexi bacterium]|nr:fumarylacetoacetate hydrolase family protein [Chloroflexota bacterium]
MRYYQFSFRGESHLGVETSDDTLYDLTSANPHASDLFALLRAASLMGVSLDHVARQVIDRGISSTFSIEEIHENSAKETHGPKFELPFLPPEVWAAGVTYESSMFERQAESDTPDVYGKVYTADRPEIFFKATPSRLSGPYGEVGIRADSTWNVPEPELAFVLFDGRVAGYTCGNDMSSRQIEGENPLYIPQAKVYDKSCAIGPCFATIEAVGDPQALSVHLSIERGGNEAFSGETSTSAMFRDCEYIADWLQRHNAVPDGTTVVTGTGVIPTMEFTLAEGDVVHIEVENIGRLTNTVVVV